MKKIGLKPVVDERTRVLILGSMPGDESLRQQRYYANPSNQFWPIMRSVLSADLGHEYDERVSRLLEHGIGLWDVLRECKREGSSDGEIQDEETNDFISFFRLWPNVTAVAFNGGKARDAFKPVRKLFRDIEYMDLPSTSAAPGRYVKPLQEKTKLWRRILKYL